MTELSAPFWIAALVAIAVFMITVVIGRLSSRSDTVADRLSAYGARAEVATAPKAKREKRLAQRLGRTRPAARLGALLVEADVPITAGEFIMVIILAAAVGLAIGMWRVNILVGIGVALGAGYLPILWAQRKSATRRSALVNQLPEVLTLITGALRAGFGLSQAIGVVVEEGPQPSAKEFARVMRATSLGASLPKALTDMAKRARSDDMDLLVTAINVQYEVGGNLTNVLENIARTIRERIRILREVRTLTSQQRMTGYILAVMPIGLAVIISFMQPGFFQPFFEPGWARVMPIVALVMMGMAFGLIQWILDIKV